MLRNCEQAQLQMAIYKHGQVMDMSAPPSDTPPSLPHPTGSLMSQVIAQAVAIMLMLMLLPEP